MSTYLLLHMRILKLKLSIKHTYLSDNNSVISILHYINFLFVDLIPNLNTSNLALNNNIYSITQNMSSHIAVTLLLKFRAHYHIYTVTPSA